jgi:RNA polymerase sigma-B factor
MDADLRRYEPKHSRDEIDPKTGIYNETYIHSRLTEEIHRLSGTDGVLSVVLIEFTGLRSLAGFYGDASVGDFIADAAEFFKSSVRSLDVVCRYGSNGFGLILPSTGPNVKVFKARVEERCTQWLATRIAPNGPVVVRVGYAVTPDDATSVADLLRIADPRYPREDAA